MFLQAANLFAFSFHQEYADILFLAFLQVKDFYRTYLGLPVDLVEDYKPRTLSFKTETCSVSCWKMGYLGTSAQGGKCSVIY